MMSHDARSRKRPCSICRHYPQGSGFDALPLAGTQAHQLAALLRQQGFVVDEFPNANKDQIDYAIKRSEAGSNDRLLVYFGGKGSDIVGFDGEDWTHRADRWEEIGSAEYGDT